MKSAFLSSRCLIGIIWLSGLTMVGLVGCGQQDTSKNEQAEQAEQMERERVKKAQLAAIEAERQAEELKRKAETDRQARQQEAEARRAGEQKAVEELRQGQREKARALAAKEAALQEARRREDDEKRKRVAEQNLTQERERISRLFVQVQDQAKKTKACVETWIRLAKTGAENLNRQASATKTKLEVFRRQTAQQERVVASILPDTKWVCPNLVCGRFVPVSTLKTIGDGTCLYCNTSLVIKDFNEERRAAAQAELDKLRQKVAFEEQISQVTNAASTESDMQSGAQYRGQLNQLVEGMDDLKIEIETADVGQLAAIEQSIQRKQEALGFIMNALPKEAVAQAATTNRPDSATPKIKPKKIYVLNDGREIEVQSEVIAGDEIIIKTSQGEMLTIDKKTIQRSTNQ